MGVHDAPAFLAAPLRWNPEWSERFDQYVVFTEDHWIWIGYVDPEDGYGRFKADGQPRRVHRLAYARWVGPLEDDDEARVIVDHNCPNGHLRTCVRPEHLKLVTYAENAANADNPIADNMHKIACDRGHPFDEANTYPVPTGGRACRTCRREWMREYRARKRSQGTPAEGPTTARQ